MCSCLAADAADDDSVGGQFDCCCGVRWRQCGANGDVSIIVNEPFHGTTNSGAWLPVLLCSANLSLPRICKCYLASTMHQQMYDNLIKDIRFAPTTVVRLEEEGKGLEGGGALEVHCKDCYQCRLKAVPADRFLLVFDWNSTEIEYHTVSISANFSSFFPLASDDQ